MSVDAVNAYFTPLDYAMYLGAIFVGMVVYYMWRWSKTCRENVLVLVQKADGHGAFELAAQAGGSVSLKNPGSNTTRMWPINELATIDVPYPGVGFVPQFLQKTIRMVIVSETDWEPLTNRSPNKDIIASPAVLGNLMHEKITEAVITVNKEMMESISGLVKRLNNLVNPMVVYIGLGLAVVLMLYMTFQVVPAVGEITDKLNAISNALGVVPSA